MEKLVLNPLIYRKIIFGILLGTTWIVAFFDKQFYVYLLPSVFIFSLAGIPFSYQLFRETFLYITIPFILIFCFILFYLTGNSIVTVFHLEKPVQFILPTYQSITGVGNEEFNLKEIILDRRIVLEEFMKSWDLSYYLQRNLQTREFRILKYVTNLRISWILMSGFLIGIFFKIKKNITLEIDFKHSWKSILYVLSFLIMLGMFFILGKVRTTHHFIFLWVPLLGLLLDNEFKYEYNPFIIGYLFFNLAICSIIIIENRPNYLIKDSYSTIVPYTQKDNPKLQIVNFDGWSYFFNRKLDNPNHHIVTSNDPRNEKQYNRLLNLADSLNIPIIEVSNKEDWGYPQFIKPNEKMDLLRKKGRIVKKINLSENLPIYLISKK